MHHPLRVAQVGVGGFGGYRRARLRETGLFKLVAACDLNPQALAAAEKEDGAKPAASCEALLGAQRASGFVVGLGHNDHRHDAVSATIQGLLAEGALGTLATFEKTTAHNGGLPIKPGDWRGDPAKNPGGMLSQCGVHALHELMFYFGPVREVICQLRSDVHTTQTADIACCILRFESGLVGTLNAHHVTPCRHTFNLLGTQANLYREELFFDGGTPYPSALDGACAVAVVFAAEESAKTGQLVNVAAADPELFDGAAARA